MPVGLSWIDSSKAISPLSLIDGRESFPPNRTGLSIERDVGRRAVVRGGLATRSGEQSLVEVELRVEVRLECHLAGVVHRGVESEEVELLRSRGDRDQLVAVAPEDGFGAGREVRRERDLA